MPIMSMNNLFSPLLWNLRRVYRAQGWLHRELHRVRHPLVNTGRSTQLRWHKQQLLGLGSFMTSTHRCTSTDPSPNPYLAPSYTLTLATPDPEIALPSALIILSESDFPNLSRARKACRKGRVMVNGAKACCATQVHPLTQP